MTTTEIVIGLIAQGVAVLATLAGFSKWVLRRVVVDHDQAKTLDRIAAWFPEERPDASESLPIRVDKTREIATEALALATDVGTRLDRHLTAEELDRSEGLKDRRKFEGKILERLEGIERRIPA